MAQIMRSLGAKLNKKNHRLLAHFEAIGLVKDIRTLRFGMSVGELTHSPHRK